MKGAAALQASRDLARREGIFCGISSGATFAGALEVCNSAPEGSSVLCMLPDTGERYLTTPLFEDVAEEMTEEETLISKSTPGARFDVQAAAPPPAEDDAPPPRVTPEAEAFVADTIASADSGVAYDTGVEVDAYSLLPSWLHPR